MSKNSVRSSASFRSIEDVREYARSRNNVQLYDYTYSTPEVVLTAKEAGERIDRTMLAVAHVLAEHNTTESAKLETDRRGALSADQIAQAVKAVHPDLAQFSRTHPKLFRKLTDKTLTMSQLNDIRYQQEMRQKVEDGVLTHEEATQVVNFYMMKRNLPEGTLPDIKQAEAPPSRP